MLIFSYRHSPVKILQLDSVELPWRIIELLSLHHRGLCEGEEHKSWHLKMPAKSFRQ